MEDGRPLFLRIVQAVRATWWFVAGAVAGLLLESVLGIQNRALLGGVLVVAVLFVLPYERVPAIARVLLGVPVRYGAVGTAETKRHIKLGSPGAVLTFSGEDGVRFIEIGAAYRVDFIDSRTAFMWKEGKGQLTAPNQRRYEDYGLAHSWPVDDGQPQTFPLHIQVMVRRDPG